jgi:hypothetical protein
MSTRLPVPAHEEHATFDAWVDALLLAIPQTDVPYPNSVLDWKTWAREIVIREPFSDYMVPGVEMQSDWREWVDDLRAEVA